MPDPVAADHHIALVEKVARLLEAVASASDIEHLRTGFRLLASALPDIVNDGSIAADLIPTCTDAVTGAWN